MKLKHALLVLALSASFMASGFAFRSAVAQPPGTAIEVNTAPGEAAPAAASGNGLQEFDDGVEYQPVAPGTRVTFNLEDADLPDLVRLISNLTGKRFILPGKVRNIKATVFAPTKVTVHEAYNAFLSILETNGLTVVPSGRYFKIAETTGIENQPIPLNFGDSATGASDRFQTRLHRLENVSAEDVSQLLTRFKSAAGSVSAYAPTNTLIITDTGTQILRMLRIIESIDVPRGGEQIWIEPIHHANAAEIATKLQEIFPSGGTTAAGSTPGRRRAAAAQTPPQPTDGPTGGTTTTVGSGPSRITSIIPDERTNSLIILATESAYLRILEMVRQLDVSLEGEGRIHVHYVQNGDASEIATTLESLIGGGGARPAGARPGAAGNAAGAAPAGAAGGDLSGLFEGAIRVTTHEPTNALVITSSLHDYAALRGVIERLDRPRRQVFIEAVVMDLSVARSNELGFSFHGGVPNPAGDGSLSIFGFDAATSVGFPVSGDALTGLALGVRGPALDQTITIPGQTTGLSIPGFGVVLNAIANTSDANVLSTPHIIAMDNVQAEINIGQNIPLQTSGFPAGGAGGLAGLAGLAGGQAGAAGLAGLAGLGGMGMGGVPRQDVGTIIRITPHINERNEIRLEVEEEISDAGAATGSLGVVPINRRTAKTELMVQDQQTVVIGGLMRETVLTTESKVPVLGDIPLLGALFRSTTRNRTKTNLLLFLTPYIIRDPSDLRAIYERKMRERQEFLDRYFVFENDDYAPNVDYTRTRGLVHEIIGSLRQQDAEAELAAALESEPDPDHHPRQPVGSYESQSGSGDVLITPSGSAPTPEQPPTPEGMSAIQ